MKIKIKEEILEIDSYIDDYLFDNFFCTEYIAIGFAYFITRREYLEIDLNYFDDLINNFIQYLKDSLNEKEKYDLTDEEYLDRLDEINFFCECIQEEKDKKYLKDFLILISDVIE